MTPHYEPKLTDNNIVLTRIRLARNIKGEKFFIEDRQKCAEVIKRVTSAAARAERFNLTYMSMADEITREALKEKHLVSQSLIDNAARSAVLINPDESVSVMIHEEDVLREQCFMRGFSLWEAYKRLDRLDDELQKSIDFAYDNKLGYLTACPTNVGTGLRASVMLFLPALTESGKIGEVIEEIERLGLTVRGVYGEGSRAEGYMYQVSNEVTLGVSESEIISGVEDAVLRVCEAERLTVKSFYSKKLLETENRCARAFGALEHSVLLGYNEFLEFIANVKLGVTLGFFEFDNPQAIDDLIVTVRPANLLLKYNREMSSQERDYYRAEFVRESLKKIRGNR